MNKSGNRSFVRKFICIVLAVLMIFDCSYQTFALTIDGISELFGTAAGSGNEYNENVVEALQALIGEDGNAAEVLDTLYAHGLVDEWGNPVYDKDYALIEDGVCSSVSDEELEELAACRKEEDRLGEPVSLDGADLTWEQICTLLNIRDTVNALTDWMSTGNYFDEDSMDMMDSLAAQLAGEGLDVSADTSEMSRLSSIRSGINQNTVVGVSFSNSSISSSNTDVTVNISVTNPQTSGYPVSFDVQPVNGTGSLSVYTSGASNASVTGPSNGVYTVKLSASQNYASFKVKYTDTDSNNRNGSRTATLQFSNIKNALFSGNKRAATLVLTRSGCTYDFASDYSFSDTKLDFSTHLETSDQNTRPNASSGRSSDYLKGLLDGKKYGAWQYTVSGECSIDTVGYGDCHHKDRSYIFGIDVNFKWGNVGSVNLSDEHSTDVHELWSYRDMVYNPSSGNIELTSDSTGKETTLKESFLVNKTNDSVSGIDGREYSLYVAVGRSNSGLTGWLNGALSVKVDGKYIPTGISLDNIRVPSGTFYSGQQVPITVTFSGDPIKLTDNLVLRVNDTNLYPYEINTCGYSATFLYTVPENCSGEISVNSLSRNGGLQFVTYDATAYTLAIDGVSEKTAFDIGTVSSNAKLRNFRDYAFKSLSVGIDDNDPGYQWVTVELGLNSDNSKEYQNWIIQGGTEAIGSLTSLSNERSDLKKVSELEDALQSFKTNAAYYKVGFYLKNMYLSVDGGNTRYPVYVVTNDKDEKDMKLVSYFKPGLNTGSQDRQDTLEVYLNQSDASIDYFTGAGLKLSAPQLIGKAGTSSRLFSVSGKTYSVKRAVFMAPGAAKLSYPTDHPYQSDWSKLVDGGDTSKLVTYYQDLGTENYLPSGSAITYKVLTDAAITMSAIYKQPEDITFTVNSTPDIYQNVNTYSLPDAFCTNTYRIEDDQLTLTATIDNTKGYTYADNDEFLWVSSNTNVANIAMMNNGYSKDDTNKKITLNAAISATGQSGNVYFTLYARNGGLDGYAPVELCRSVELLCAAGTKPILKVPSTTDGIPELSTAEGSALSVNFTSTVVSVNKTVYNNTPSIFNNDLSNLYTKYTIELYELNAEGELEAGDSPIFTYTEDARKGDSIIEPGCMVIPRGILTRLNGAYPSYRAVITSVVQTLNRDGGITEVPMTAEVNIKVIANPPSVTLNQLPAYSYLSGQNINLSWKTGNVREDMTGTLTVSYPDSEGNLHTKNSVNIIGTNSVNLSDLTVPEGELKQSYVVTASITGDGVAPAVDSCVITIYDSTALKILVNGIDEGSAYTMDNHDGISAMADENGVIDLAGHSTTIQKLANDTNLKEIISINYGQYVWGQLSDQIKWAAHDLDSGGNEIYYITSRDTEGNVLRSTAISLEEGVEEDKSRETGATLNFSQGGSYSNINSYSYVSYSPYSQFAVSGLSDGKTRITATHASTGMKAVLDVETIRLENQLYLFQFYPRQVTTVTYTNGKGESCEVMSNANGELALYEPDSIASNVQLYAKDSDNASYIGSIALDKLASGEQDATKLRSYPVNIAKLKDVASVTLYIPGYEGKSVIIRGGVYKNGSYCENALLGTTDNAGKMKPGTTGQAFTIDSSGKTTVYFNSAQFYTEDELTELDRMINGGDELEYIFELRFYNGGTEELYQPQVIHVSATADETSVARAGEKAVKLREVGNFRNSPVVSWQNLILYDREGNYAITKDIYESREGVGISYQYPHGIVETEMLIWGTDTKLADPSVNVSEYSFYLRDENDFTPTSQLSEDYTYPFSTIPVVRNTWDMTTTGINSWTPSGHETVMIQHSEADGVTIKDAVNPWKFTNSTATNPSTDKDKKKAQQDAIDAINSQLDPGSILGTVKEQADGKTQKAFAVLENLSIDGGGIPISIVVCPTEDSFAFHCVITVGHGNGDNTHASDDLNSSDDENEADEDEAKEDAEDSDPFRIKMGDYATLSLGGYVMGNLTYSPDSGKWSFVFVGGGFTSDLDFAVEWVNNFMVGPVPAVVSFKIGINLNVNIGFAVTYLGENQGNDFLLTVGIMAYVEAFAGVGFDAGVVAIKLGIFGRIEVGDQFKTLVTMNWENLPVPDTKTYIGNKAYILGSIGLKFTCKVLFVSYSNTFASVSWGKDWKQGDFEDIEAYWEERTQGNTSGTLKVGGSGIDVSDMYGSIASGTMLDSENNTILYAISDSLVETRSYQKLGASKWSGGRSITPYTAVDADSGAKVGELLYNGYTYAQPQYNSDGTIIVYLSDANSSAAEDTVASYAVWNGTLYENRFGIDPVTYVNDTLNNETNEPGADGKLDPVYYPLDYSDEDMRGTLITSNRTDKRTGYGDSSLAVSGTNDLTVAAWVRQKTDAGKKAGESVSNEDLANAMNSTEIYASVWENGNWTSTAALTANSYPDMAPSVAVKGSRAVVAWRQVACSDTADPLDFDTMDNLVYSVYDGNSWSSPVMVYNGETGSIEGMETAIDGDGSIIILYSIKTGDDDETSTDTEIMYTYIPANAEDDAKKGTAVRLTNNDELDKNVDVCNVTWQNRSQFIAAWYNEDADGNGDIQLRAIYGASGLPNADMAESAAAAGAEGITGNFRLSAPASGAALNNLSVIWQEDVDCSAPFAMSITKGGKTSYYDADGNIVTGVSEEGYVPDMVSKDGSTTTKYYNSSSKSTLKAVQFYSNETGSITVVGVTSPVEIAALESGNTIDSFSAYNEEGGRVMHAVMQSSNYNGMDLSNPASYTTHKVVQHATDASGTAIQLEAEVYTAVETTNMLTAAGSYTCCDFDVNADFNGDDIVSQYDMPLQFTVTNKGTEIISKIHIESADAFDKTYENLSIFPGESSSFTLYYYVPERISNLTASVTAITAENHSDIKSVSVKLFRPEIEIRGAAVSKAENQSRILSMTLNNTTDIMLKENAEGCRVKLAAYGTAEDCRNNENPMDIETYESSHDLGLIDAGAFNAVLTLSAINLRDLMKAQYPDSSDASEIPSTGLMVYLRTWIEDADGKVLQILDSEGETVWTNIGISNDAQLKVSSLIDSSDQESLSISTYMKLEKTEPENDGAAIAEAVAEVKNLSFCKSISSENIRMSAVLLDKNGSMISSQKTSSVSGMGPEQTASNIISFTKGDLLEGHSKDEISDAYIVYGVGDSTSDTALLKDLTVSGQNLSLAGLMEGATAETSGEQGMTVNTYKLSKRLDTSALSTMITAIPANPGDIVKIAVDGTELVSGGGMQLANAVFSRGGSELTLSVVHNLKETVYRISLTVPSYHSSGGGSGSTSSAAIEVIPVISGGSIKFTDVIEKDYFYDAVNWAVDNGITSGIDAAHFAPEKITTRAQMVTFLWRAAGCPDTGLTAKFSDISSDSYYAKAVAWAVEMGITNGISETSFAPDGSVTRAQAVTFLSRLAGGETAASETFTDVPAGSYYSGAVAWAVKNNITTGISGTSFAPENDCKRAQVVTFLYRYFAK